MLIDNIYQVGEMVTCDVSALLLKDDKPRGSVDVEDEFSYWAGYYVGPAEHVPGWHYVTPLDVKPGFTAFVSADALSRATREQKGQIDGTRWVKMLIGETSEEIEWANPSGSEEADERYGRAFWEAAIETAHTYDYPVPPFVGGA